MENQIFNYATLQPPLSNADEEEGFDTESERGSDSEEDDFQSISQYYEDPSDDEKEKSDQDKSQKPAHLNPEAKKEHQPIVPSTGAFPSQTPKKPPKKFAIPALKFPTLQIQSAAIGEPQAPLT